MVQVELNNMYINMCANKSSEKLLKKKNTATSGKVIEAVYAITIYYHILQSINMSYIIYCRQPQN
jgi:hypothetical protein